jgi:hypothetical protein
LASLRVWDVGGADSDAVSRLFGDLGAGVLKIELPGGVADRVARPMVAGTGVAFALQNANKRSAMLEAGSATDRDRFINLAGEADINTAIGVLAHIDATAQRRAATCRSTTPTWTRYSTISSGIPASGAPTKSPTIGARRCHRR